MPTSKRPARRADSTPEHHDEISRLLAAEDLETQVDETQPVPDFDAIDEQVQQNEAAEEQPAMIKPTGVSHATPRAAEVITIHFLENGFTVADKVYYTGDELTVTEGTAEWDKAHDANGYTWMTENKWEQIHRYGKQMFDQGPWMGEGYDLNDPNLSPEDRAKLEAVMLKRAIRSASPSGRTSDDVPVAAVAGGVRTRPSFLAGG